MHLPRTSSRRGVTLTELVVAATLLSSAMAIVAPLIVRGGRLWQDTRHQQLAIDELCNQLERLTSLEADQRELALANLEASDHLRETLPGVTLTAETTRDEHGTRLTLGIEWDRRVKSVPVTLVGWLNPLPDDSSETEVPSS